MTEQRDRRHGGSPLSPIPLQPDLSPLQPDLFPLRPDLFPLELDLFPLEPDLIPLEPDVFPLELCGLANGGQESAAGEGRLVRTNSEEAITFGVDLEQ